MRGYKKFFEYYNQEIITESDKFNAHLLKSARISAMISQAELAQRLNISQRSIHNIENAKTRGVSYLRYSPKWHKWLKACGVVVSFKLTIIADDNYIKHSGNCVKNNSSNKRFMKQDRI